jgi:MFS family permease
MWIQAAALVWFWSADRFSQMVGAAILLGLGTALTYPALLAAVGDLTAPSWRASAVGVYRTWRDGGYVVGAITAGVLADVFSPGTALVTAAGVTALSGLDAWTNLGSSSVDLNTLG